MVQAAYGTPGNASYVNPFAPQPPANTYTGPINDKITSAQGRDLVNANQAQAAKMGIYIPGSSEPAVISSSTISDQIIPDAKKKLAEMQTKGTTADANGNVYHADGSMAAPAGTVYDSATGQYKAEEGKDYSVASFYGNGAEDKGDADWQAVQAQFAPLKSQLDAQTLGLVNTIHQQFDALRAQQAQLNTASQGARQRLLLMSGTSRYAPLDAAGMTLAQTSYGLQQIANLDAQENTAISNAQQAATTNNMKLLSDSMTMAEDIRKQKQTAASKVIDQLNAANQKANEINLQASRDTAIADIVTKQHLTDPAMILKQLNEHEDGSKTGNNFTSDEVSKALKNMTVAGTDPKDISQDLATFNYIKSTPGLGLPKEIKALPPEEQYFAYLAMIKKSESAPKAAAASASQGAGSDVPTWEEYKAAAQKASGVNYFMKPEEDQLRIQYDEKYGQYEGGAKPEKFTPTELKKLEQAGLLNAARQKQLDFLFKKSGSDTTPPPDYPTAIQ